MDYCMPLPSKLICKNLTFCTLSRNKKFGVEHFCWNRGENRTRVWAKIGGSYHVSRTIQTVAVTFLVLGRQHTPMKVYLVRTSREVNEARGGLILATGRVRSKKKNEKKKTRNPTKRKKKKTRNMSTAARRPRPPRVGVQWNTSRSLAHTRTLSP